MIELLAFDSGGTTTAIGVGALATALVTVTGYMLFNSRDSDRRVDDAQAQIAEVLKDQRDEARTERDLARAECQREREARRIEADRASRQRTELREELNTVYNDRNDALERVRILQMRLGVQPEEDQP